MASQANTFCGCVFTDGLANYAVEQVSHKQTLCSIKICTVHDIVCITL